MMVPDGLLGQLFAVFCQNWVSEGGGDAGLCHKLLVEVWAEAVCQNLKVEEVMQVSGRDQEVSGCRCLARTAGGVTGAGCW